MLTNKTRKILENANRPCCVLLGATTITGLSLIRDLGIKKIPTICLDSSRFAIASFSRYCSSFESYNSYEGLLLKMAEIGKLSRKRDIIFCESDKYLLFLDKNKEILREYFDFPYPSKIGLRELMNKRVQHRLAEESGVSVPFTLYSDEFSLLEIKNKIIYPSIIKPLYSQVEYRKKGEIVQDWDDLERVVKQERFSGGYIIQEIIDGPEDNIWICAGYCDKDSKPLAVFTGYKHRQVPKDFGVATVAISRQNKVVVDLTLSFLRKVGYYGCFEIEYKKCRYKDEYKFFEINPRLAMWNDLVTSSGINLPYIAYCDFVGLPLPDIIRQKNGVLWHSIIDDFITIAKYYSKSNKFLFIDWLRTIFKTDVYGDFSMGDIAPFICKLFMHILRIVKRKL